MPTLPDLDGALVAALAGTRVVLQMHGDDRQVLTPMLQAQGAEVIESPSTAGRCPMTNAPPCA